MDLDEGINLVKAQMVLRDYPLYSQVWSDQPPFLTYLLAVILHFFGMEASVGRVLVLLLACGLIWAYIHYLKIVWGKWHAVSGFILLILVPQFIELSVSVMVGLPAIIFAVFSMLALTYWHIHRKYSWIVISAVLLAVSTLTKIFTAFLAPIFFLGIIVGEYGRFSEVKIIKNYLRPAVIWGGIYTLAVALPILLIVSPGNFDQLFGNHLDAAGLATYRSDPDYWLGTQLIAARPLLLLALLGIVSAVLSKRWLALYPAFWMVSAYLLLWRHVPVWSHQQLLVTIPAAFMAAGAVGEALNRFVPGLRTRFRFKKRDLIHLTSMGLFIYLLLLQAPVTTAPFQTSPIIAAPRYKQTTTEAKFMKIVLQYAPDTQWMVTDMPMYAFYADIPVPPNLVVFSSKRLETGNLTEEQIIRTIEAVGAEQVLLGRNELPVIREYLRKNYQLVHSKDLIELYVSRDIISASQPP